MCLQFMYYHYYYITSESANAEHHSFLLLFSFLRHLSFRNLIQDSRVVEVRVVGMIGQFLVHVEGGTAHKFRFVIICKIMLIEKAELQCFTTSLPDVGQFSSSSS